MNTATDRPTSFMRAARLALALLAPPCATAFGQPSPEQLWIAVRYDRTRVVIYFDSVTFHGTIPKGARRLAPPATMFSFETHVLPADYLARLRRTPGAERFAIGDHYDVLLNGGRALTVTLTTLVGFQSDEYVGNESYIGALGTVAKSDVQYLAKYPYFVARRHVDRTPGAAGQSVRGWGAAGLVDDAVPADIKQRLAALLREHFRTDEDSIVRANVQKSRPVLDNVQTFRLADGALRYYAQAKMADTSICIRMTAWMMPPPAPRVMAATAEYCMGDGPKGSPELLSVIALGGGRTGLIVFVPGGDGASWELVEYRDGVGLNKMRVLQRLSFGE